MDAGQFERRLRALAVREGMTFATFATLGGHDRSVLQTTIVARFDPGATYSERQVNDILRQWLGSVGAMVETDHVHVRRWLVDTRVLDRTADCAAYRVHPDLVGRADVLRGDDIAALDAAAIVADERRRKHDERSKRKAEWLARSAQSGGAGNTTAR